ncbi:hypothetical protein GCM10020366_22490 [Saccharopolyspora gregorii]|uniref:MFS transporter n=1 Tax=Saccharopolyspora gregorii TaxID=33914 RepID=A0ABP6RMY3_9PSEU
MTAPPSSARRVAFAGLIGTTIEWFDFFIYGTAAALVFNRLSSPSSNRCSAPSPRSRPSPSGSSRGRWAGCCSRTTGTGTGGNRCWSRRCC